MSVSLFYEPFYTAADFNRLFDDAVASLTSDGSCDTRLQRRSNGGGAAGRSLTPRMDIHEDTKNNVVTASFELPGLSKNDVQIDVQHGRLTISGQTSENKESEEGGYAIRERHFGKFSRTLQLPQDIKAEEVKATMENGVLTVTFPKSAPEAAPKRISIA